MLSRSANSFTPEILDYVCCGWVNCWQVSHPHRETKTIGSSSCIATTNASHQERQQYFSRGGSTMQSFSQEGCASSPLHTRTLSTGRFNLLHHRPEGFLLDDMSVVGQVSRLFVFVPKPNGTQTRHAQHRVAFRPHRAQPSAGSLAGSPKPVTGSESTTYPRKSFHKAAA